MATTCEHKELEVNDLATVTRVLQRKHHRNSTIFMVQQKLRVLLLHVRFVERTWKKPCICSPIWLWPQFSSRTSFSFPNFFYNQKKYLQTRLLIDSFITKSPERYKKNLVWVRNVIISWLRVRLGVILNRTKSFFRKTTLKCPFSIWLFRLKCYFW